MQSRNSKSARNVLEGGMLITVAARGVLSVETERIPVVGRWSAKNVRQGVFPTRSEVIAIRVRRGTARNREGRAAAGNQRSRSRKMGLG